jgi:hypothetical protein
MRRILKALATLSLVGALLVSVQVHSQDDQLWWALLLGSLGSLAVNLTVAASQAKS